MADALPESLDNAEASPQEELQQQPQQAEDEQQPEAAQPEHQQDAVDQELTGDSWGPLAPLAPPPEGCVPVTEDGGVLKLVLQPGEGPKPKLYARCLVHYIGRLQSNGSIFLDTRVESQTQQPVKVVAGRHSSPKETGLFQAVATMCMGERAAIYIQDPKYGYGETGSFSFPAVPPSAQLVYEVEFVDFEDPNPHDDTGEVENLLYEERLERAEQRRLQGNDLFAQGMYKAALAKYAVGLSYLDEDFMMQLEGFYEEKAHEVKVPIHLNMAACQLRTKDYNTAIYNCGQVLTLQPDNAKALFRRGTARHALGQTEEALKDLLKAAEKAPGDQAIAKELAALRQSLKAEREAEAKLFKGQFKFPEPVPQQPATQQEHEGTAGGGPAACNQGLRHRGAKAAHGGEAGQGEAAAAGQEGGARGIRKGWLGWLLGVLLALLGSVWSLLLRPAAVKA